MSSLLCIMGGEDAGLSSRGGEETYLGCSDLCRCVAVQHMKGVLDLGATYEKGMMSISWDLKCWRVDGSARPWYIFCLLVMKSGAIGDS